ncbi:MAG TPA: hypothetical protein VGH93_03100, partial [Solirubrobacteraceae bacterium]
GSDPQADLTSWYTTVNAGEPYGSQATFVANQIAQFHSPFYLLDGKYGTPLEAPAPLLIANGFTDDLFPVDEALRYYNLERALYPSDPLQLVDGDFGHMRANNKPADVALLSSRIEQFFDAYLNPRRSAGPPSSGVTASIETCPSGAPSGPTYSASTWAGLHPGEVYFASPLSQTVTSGAGNPAISQAIDPISGPGACATVTATDQGAGVATYRLPAASGRGYTLLGSPTVIAKLALSGTYPEVASRLWDVDPTTNTETLVARGLYRPSASGEQVFQLHPGAWHFAAGHIPKLELLAQDSPYGRTSNGSFSIAVSGLQLRLPVHELPRSSRVIAAPRVPVILGCSGLPAARVQTARINRYGEVSVHGTASDQSCPSAGTTISSRQRLARVSLIVYRTAGFGHCRFLQPNGRLSRPRLCSDPVELPVRGGARRWGFFGRVRNEYHSRYLIVPDAVDRLGQHQLPVAPYAVDAP